MGYAHLFVLGFSPVSTSTASGRHPKADRTRWAKTARRQVDSRAQSVSSLSATGSTGPASMGSPLPKQQRDTPAQRGWSLLRPQDVRGQCRSERPSCTDPLVALNPTAVMLNDPSDIQQRDQ